MCAGVPAGESRHAGAGPAAGMSCARSLTWAFCWDSAPSRTCWPSFGFDRTPSVGLAAAAASPIAVPEDPDGLRAAAIGQHGLTVSPLQMARAFAALAGGGNLPALRLVDAVGMPDGSWVPLPGSNIVGATVPSSDAESILGALRIPGSGFAGMSARAVVGAESGFITWFLGASTGEADPRVVVVLLEVGTPVEARSIGLTVLAAASQ